VSRLLESRNVNLRLMEREDVDFIVKLRNDLCSNVYVSVKQMSKTETLKDFDNPGPLALLTERTSFIIEKKDGAKIGYLTHWVVQPSKHIEIGYFMIPEERGKGYCSEAAQIIVDYLFLSKDIVRIQAGTNVGNKASQKVLENVGFVREGTVRKSAFNRGEWSDGYLYSILREEWKEPRILGKNLRGQKSRLMEPRVH
jgi:RimJ/RimL family protein N-acetyltransferase